MSQDGNTDDAVLLPQEGEVSSPLLPAEVGVPAQFMPAQYMPAQYMPAQYMPASAEIPAEPLQGEPLEPLQPLQPAQYMPAQYMPAQYMPALPADPGLPPEHFDVTEPTQYAPAEPLLPAQDEPAQPLMPAERVGVLDDAGMLQGRVEEEPLAPLLARTEALPLEPDGTPERTPERTWYRAVEPDQLREPEQGEPRFYKSTRPDAIADREPAQAEPRAYESTGPASKPAMLDREAARQQPGDGDPPGGNGNPPADGNPPDGNDNPPGNGDNPPSGTGSGTGTGSGASVFVDTEKLSQAIPGLDGIMRRMYAISNGTANALNAFQLDRGDSYGEAYVKTADPISSQILEGLSNAGGVFGDTAEGAGLMVHNYNVTEENAVESAGGLLARSGEG